MNFKIFPKIFFSPRSIDEHTHTAVLTETERKCQIKRIFIDFCRYIFGRRRLSISTVLCTFIFCIRSYFSLWNMSFSHIIYFYTASFTSNSRSIERNGQWRSDMFFIVLHSVLPTKIIFRRNINWMVMTGYHAEYIWLFRVCGLSSVWIVCKLKSLRINM